MGVVSVSSHVRKGPAVDLPQLSHADEPLLNALRARVGGDGASVRRIARFLGVDSGVILAWLAGRRKPRRATRERIAAFLQGKPRGDPNVCNVTRLPNDPPWPTADKGSLKRLTQVAGLGA
jgi:hypothetical protein